jgi:hypothetical protein
LITPINTLSAQLQTVQRGMSRKRFAFMTLQEPILPQWIAFATDQSMDRIPPQMLMIIKIFIAQY